jgi:putative protease
MEVMKKKAAAKGVKKQTKSTAKPATKKKATAGKSNKKTAAKKTAVRATAKPKTAKKKTTAKAATQKTAKKKTVKKPAARKKPTASRTAPKVSKPVAPMRPPEAPETPAYSMPSIPSMTAVPPSAPPVERPIGVVNHYYSHLGVAVIQLNDDRVQVGETILIKGHTTDLRQQIESIEIDHQSVQEASAGQVFGVKVRDHVREHDQIYKTSDPS